MKKREFELILEKSLTQLEADVSLQEILKENPRYSEKLEPLLQAALSAWSLPETDYQKSMREGRNRLLVEVDRMKTSGAFTKNGTKSKKSPVIQDSGSKILVVYWLERRMQK